MKLDDVTIAGSRHAARLKFAPYLYSRDAEQERLRSAFEHVCRTGSHALVVISGPSGVGKSALLNTFSEQLLDRDASIAAGKVNQYLRNTPYFGLIDAFRSLVLQILREPEENRQFWKKRLSTMLGQHADLAVSLIPELDALLGNCSQEAQHVSLNSEVHFQGLIHNLINGFSLPERPLVLLIDDVHWVDSATARVLEYVVGASAALPFMLVLTSREELQEGTLGIPTTLPMLRLRARHSQEIRLEPLSLLALENFLADTLKSFQSDMHEVAELLHEKSKGNPFFVRQLLNAIADEGLMWFNHKDLAWQFDLARMRALEYSDSIAELMLKRLARLPHATQTILASLANLDKDIGLTMLSDLLQQDETVLHTLMQEAVEAELVVLKPQGYGFFHDRVQESAFAMISPQARMKLHLRAAEVLLRNTSALERDDDVFQIADHLAHGVDAVTETTTCLEFAKLALLAAQRAKRATAYACALSYVGTGIAYLTLSGEDRQHDIGFALEFERAECEFLLGNVPVAYQLTEQLIATKPDRLGLAAICRLQAEIFQRRSDNWLAVEQALNGLRLLGIDIPTQPSTLDCDIAYAAIKVVLGVDPQARIAHLAPMENADIQAAVALLSVLRCCAAVTHDGLHFIGLCHLIDLHMQYGFTTHLPCALGWFGVQIAHRFSHAEDGFRYAELGRELAAENRYASNVARAIMPLQQVSVWIWPLQFSIDCAREGFKLAAANADVTTACYASCDLISTQLVKNVSLTDIRAEIARALLFAHHVSFPDAEDILHLQRKFVDHLLGAGHPHPFPAECLTIRTSAETSGVQPLSTLTFLDYLYAAIRHFHAGEWESASRSIDLAEALTWSAPAHIHLLNFHFFASLILTAPKVTPCDQATTRQKLRHHHAVIANWATENPTTFADKEAIVRAEIARLDGDTMAALLAFEQAIEHASESGSLHYLGIAHGLAARLAETCGYRTAACAHARAAHAAYLKWGSLTLAQQLERHHSSLLNAAPLNTTQVTTQALIVDHTGAHKTGIRGIDEVRYLSAALTTRDVIHRLLLTVLERVGAGKCVFIFCDGANRQVKAVAKATAYGTAVEHVSRAVNEDDIPQAVLQRTIKTRHPVSVESQDALHHQDTYAELGKVERFSALSIPISRESKLAGVLYVEIFSSTAAFSREELELLQLLASHTGVVLHNARQYDALVCENEEHRVTESELRSSQSSLILGEQFSHTGSMRWIIKDDLMVCSAELCRIYGLPPGKASLSFSEFMEIIHPDDRVSVAFVIHEAVPEGGTVRVEHRICRPDGTIRYVAGIGKPIYVNGVIEEYVGSASDVTMRRQSEDALRIAQADLARVSRAITVGQLTASIAHEINQPLMSIVSNAGASLRWLERNPIDLAMVSLGLKDIAAEGKRAGDIIKGLQSLTRNSVPVFELLDLHATFKHVLAISRGEFERHCISVDLDLMARNSSLMGDCVQIQQVLLNLVVNAIEAMTEINDRPRILSISTSNSDAQSLLVRVKDTGPGLAITQLGKVFDAFYTTKKNGMGMGLAICRSIIEAHHGTLQVGIRDPFGLEFHFRLPLAGKLSSDFN